MYGVLREVLNLSPVIAVLKESQRLSENKQVRCLSELVQALKIVIKLLKKRVKKQKPVFTRRKTVKTGNKDEMAFNAKERKNKDSLKNKDKRRQALKEVYANHRDELLKNPDKKEEILKNQRKADFMAQRQKERQEKNRQEQMKKGIIREKGTTKTQPRENYQKFKSAYKQKAQVQNYEIGLEQPNRVNHYLKVTNLEK